MINPDVETYRVVAGSKDVGAGLAIYDLLVASRDELREANDTAKGDEVLLNQGELRGVNVLISLFEDAREVQKRAGGHAQMQHFMEEGSAGL